MSSSDFHLSRIWKKHYAIPSEHGSWIWWIGPLVLGAFAGGKWTQALIWLIIAALAAFLGRQPATILVKTLNQRRSERERMPALIWLLVYATIALTAIWQLIHLDYSQVLWLAIPAVPILTWHFYLIAKRRERKQMGIELIGTGALALAAPAAYWVSGGSDPVLPWVLWFISWFQSAASITLVYYRLDQRHWDEGLSLASRLMPAFRHLSYHVFNFLLGWMIVLTTGLNAAVGLAFGIMLLDALDAVARPAINTQPTRLGLRQLFLSTLFYLLMIFAVG